MRLLLIHSMAVHGTASMKAMTTILGSRVLPVPSLWLTGLTNIPGHQKFAPPFEEMLMGSLEIARNRGETLVLYVGYLGQKKQVDIILRAIETYRDIIRMVMVDPVSGDHDRLYVPREIAAEWPRLLLKADWAFPNFTELKVHAGIGLHENIGEEEVLKDFGQRYPQLSFVVTSLERADKMGILLRHKAESREYQHEKLSRYFGGTGDVFAAYFIKKFLFKQSTPWESLTYAADKTLNCIRQSIKSGNDFLAIE